MKNTLPYLQDFSHLARHLTGKGLFHMQPGLERMERILARLGLARPPFFVVQVVGTNGKGSVSTMLSSLARAHGLRVGTHTSPHFVSPRERIAVDGAALSEELWVEGARCIFDHGGDELSYFELVTTLAVVLFARQQVDVAVMETGLGGTWDATTALAADMVLMTPIALDHERVLGATLAAIARDKAGALRPGVPVISAPQRPEAVQEITLAAQQKHAPLLFVRPASLPGLSVSPPHRHGHSHGDAPPVSVEQPAPAAPLAPEATPADGLSQPVPWPYAGELPHLALAGGHQFTNAALALAGWRVMSAALRVQAEGTSTQGVAAPQPQTGGGASALPVAGSAVFSAVGQPQHPEGEAAALKRAWLPGRMQVVPADGRPHPLLPQGLPLTILDGAHNPHGLAALGLALARQGIAPLAVVFSCLEDKDVPAMLPHLRSLATGAVFVPPIVDNPRAMAPEKLARLIGLNAFPMPSLAEAVEAAVAHMAERMPEVFTAPGQRHPLLVCGSLYLLGEFYRLFPHTLHAPGE